MMDIEHMNFMVDFDEHNTILYWRIRDRVMSIVFVKKVVSHYQAIFIFFQFQKVEAGTYPKIGNTQ